MKLHLASIKQNGGLVLFPTAKAPIVWWKISIQAIITVSPTVQYPVVLYPLRACLMNSVNTPNLRLKRGWLCHWMAQLTQAQCQKVLISRQIPQSIGLVVQHAAMPCQSMPPGICRLQLAGECATFPGADESTSVPIDCKSIATSHFSFSVSAAASVSNQIRVAGW